MRRGKKEPFMDSSRFLYLHGVDPEAWAKRHEITPYTGPCGQCGRELTTSLPFVQGTLRGLRAPPCECGNEQTPYCVVRDSRHGDLFGGA